MSAAILCISASQSIECAEKTQNPVSDNVALTPGKSLFAWASNEAASRRKRMYRVRQEELPFVGSSHEFVGSEQGDVGVSVFLFSGLPGKGPGPHRHPYDEIQFV